MKDLTLSDFLNFVKKPGAQKIAFLEQVLNRGLYKPEEDYYLGVRRNLIESAKNGLSKEALKEFLQKVNPKKHGHYKLIIDGYYRFLNNKELQWVVPPNGALVSENLRIKINPEIGLLLNDKRLAIKLYFKKEKIAKEEANLVISLMEKSFKDTGFQSALLDVRRSKLHFIEDSSKPYIVLAESEMDLISRLLKSKAA